MAKALERQARKLRAKGITVDLESLRADYLSQHHVTSESDLEDDDPQIDVVGEDDSCERSNEAIHPLLMAAAAVERRNNIGGGGGGGAASGDDGRDSRRADVGESDTQPSSANSAASITLASSYKRNPFSIEALLYNPA